MQVATRPVEQGDMDETAQDRAAYDTFASALRPELLGYFRRRTGRAEAAEEMTQDAIVRFVEGGYDPRGGEARPIVYGIARHILADHLQRLRRENAVGMAPFDEDRVAAIPSAAPTPERILAAKHDLKQAAAVIETLPPKARAAFLLSRLHGLKHADIATRLGVSKSMVEKYIMDANARLMRGALR